MGFEVIHVRPPGFVHAEALAEIAEYLRVMVPATAELRVIVGAHLLPASELATLPPAVVLFNSEPLGERGPAYREALGRHRVWDYTPVHRELVPHARVVPFGFCAAMVRTERVRSPGEALVFHGVVPRRRREILTGLARLRVPVRAVTGEYGVMRDVRMMRARAILNLHKTDDARVFQPVRCFYALTNRIPVISEETSDPMAEAFRPAMTFLGEDFVERVAELLRDPAWDGEARAQAFAPVSLTELVEATLSDRSSP